MTTQELIKKFLDSNLMVDKEVVKEIVERDDTHKYLLDIMKDDKYWDDYTWTQIHVFFILGLKRDDKAFEILEYTITHRVEEMDDWITEDLPSILFSFGIKYFDNIKKIAFNTSLDMFVRIAALESLCAFGVVNNRLINEVAILCKQVLREEKNKEIVALVLPNMAEVMDEELFEMIKEFYKKNRDAKKVTDLQDLTELHNEKSSHPEYVHCTKNLWEHFSKENLNYLYKVNK